MIRKIKVIGLIFICLIITSNNILGAPPKYKALKEAYKIAVAVLTSKSFEYIVDYATGKLKLSDPKDLKDRLITSEFQLRQDDPETAYKIRNLEQRINSQTTKDEYDRMASDIINSINTRIAKLESRIDDHEGRILALEQKYVERFKDNGNGTITDHSMSLIWQKSGSPNWLSYEEAKAYVENLNSEGFAGHSDWRLPTLIELKSLLTQEKQSNGLYINPIFDSTQFWCWTSEERASGRAWSVFFNSGLVCRSSDGDDYVRAVRSRQ